MQFEQIIYEDKAKTIKKKTSNTFPVPLKSCSLKDVTITGTQVKEIPVDFPVNMDALLNRTDQLSLKSVLSW